MIKNRDIVFINLTPWNYSIGNNACNMAEEMARHNRVLYVNPPLDRNTLMRPNPSPDVLQRRDVRAGRRPALEQAAENLWVLTPPVVLESINQVPFSWLFDRLNRLNNRRLAAAIQPVLAQLGFRDIILINDNEIFRGFYMKEMLGAGLYLYYIRDYLRAVDYWKRHGDRIEPLHMAKADAVIANSVYLADYGRQYNARSFYVGQGCDLGLWRPEAAAAVPDALAQLPGPVIGYVGTLYALRLDIGLLEYIAKAMPACSIALVGPEDEAFKASVLHQLPNVHFFGPMPPASLPAWVKGFDVCINPQALNPVTIGNYPRKVDEYLAMGKPVVATRTRAMEVFEAHCYLAETQDAWVQAIGQALAEDNRERANARQAFAATHTWEQNIAEVYRAIESLQSLHPQHVS